MGIPEAGRSKTPELQKILGFFVSLGAKRHFSKEAEREREREGERERTAAFRGTRCRFACSSSERPPPFGRFWAFRALCPSSRRFRRTIDESTDATDESTPSASWCRGAEAERRSGQRRADAETVERLEATQRQSAFVSLL